MKRRKKSIWKMGDCGRWDGCWESKSTCIARQCGAPAAAQSPCPQLDTHHDLHHGHIVQHSAWALPQVRERRLHLVGLAQTGLAKQQVVGGEDLKHAARESSGDAMRGMAW